MFPNSIQLLCTFHFLQACYRWLQSAVSSTNKQKIIYVVICNLVYKQSEEAFEEKFNAFMKQETIKPNVEKYMEQIYAKRNR